MTCLFFLSFSCFQNCPSRVPTDNCTVCYLVIWGYSHSVSAFLSRNCMKALILFYILWRNGVIPINRNFWSGLRFPPTNWTARFWHLFVVFECSAPVITPDRPVMNSGPYDSRSGFPAAASSADRFDARYSAGPAANEGKRKCLPFLGSYKGIDC